MNSISQVLSTLKVSGDEELKANSEILQAIEEFRSHLPREIGQTRKELKELETSLNKTKEYLGALSPQALSMFCEEIEAPRGLATQRIDSLMSAAQRALDKATKLPNKVPDVARNVLCGQVARILDSLGEKLALTRDTDENVTGGRGGAVYARLLKATLAHAGDQPPADPLPLMRIGLKYLDNPRGDECCSSE